MAISPGRLAVRDLFLLTIGAFLYTIASPPYDWPSAAWFALTPLFLVLRHTTLTTGFVAGFLYGVLACGGIAYWVYFAIAAYFPVPFPLDLFFVVLSYSFFVGPYTGLAATLSCALMRSDQPVFRWVGVPAVWVSSEWLRSSLFSGFAWELLGYTQYRQLSLIQIADITGVYGLSFLMAFSSYIVAEILLSLYPFPSTIPNPRSAMTIRFPWFALGALVGSILLILLYGTLRMRQYSSPAGQPVTIALVQGNVPSEQRWQRMYYAGTLLKYLSLTRQGVVGVRPDLVVWPEFAVGFYLDREPHLRAQLNWLLQELRVFLLLGAPRMEESSAEGPRFYNSASLLSPTGKLTHYYDKRRLIPFAEYRPFAFPALLHHSPEYPSEFTAGRHSTIFSFPRGKFGVMICYEATYPQLARGLVQKGATFLVNISNDTWMGKEAAAAQHFSMTVFRAVENKRPLVRVATAGISGFVTPTGVPYQLSAQGEGVLLSAQGEGVLRGAVIPAQELTVYARYGDWFAIMCTGFAMGALLTRRRVSQIRQRQ